jgi:aspartate 1-decarboxylase
MSREDAAHIEQKVVFVDEKNKPTNVQIKRV